MIGLPTPPRAPVIHSKKGKKPLNNVQTQPGGLLSC